MCVCHMEHYKEEHGGRSLGSEPLRSIFTNRCEFKPPLEAFIVTKTLTKEWNACRRNMSRGMVC